MCKSKATEQQHWLPSGYVLWICKHRVPGLNPTLDIIIFSSMFFLVDMYSGFVSIEFQV